MRQVLQSVTFITEWDVAKENDYIIIGNLNNLARHRSSRPGVFCKKGVLRNFAKFTGKHLCQSLFFNKVAGLRPATLLKKRLWHRCFPVNFGKFLRTPFITEHLWWLLLATTHSYNGFKTFRWFDMWKCHYLLCYYKHSARTRSYDVLLIVSKIKLHFVRSSLFFVGLRVFNSLPIEIRQCDTLFSFCNKVQYLSWWNIIDF